MSGGPGATTIGFGTRDAFVRICGRASKLEKGSLHNVKLFPIRSQQLPFSCLQMALTRTLRTIFFFSFPAAPSIATTASGFKAATHVVSKVQIRRPKLARLRSFRAVTAKWRYRYGMHAIFQAQNSYTANKKRSRSGNRQVAASTKSKM